MPPNTEEDRVRGLSPYDFKRLSQELGIQGNKSSFATGQATVTTHGTAVQLSGSSVPVPDGFGLTVIAKPGNSGTIYLGNSKANAENDTIRFDGLSAGLAVSLKVTDVNLVWVDSSDDGEGVSWIVEQD